MISSRGESAPSCCWTVLQTLDCPTLASVRFHGNSEWPRSCIVLCGHCRTQKIAAVLLRNTRVCPPPKKDNEMKRLTLLAVLVTRVAAVGQNISSSETWSRTSWVPHPIVLSGPSLLGNGYQAVALNGGAGILLNSRLVLGDVEARYMNARKTNSFSRPVRGPCPARPEAQMNGPRAGRLNGGALGAGAHLRPIPKALLAEGRDRP